MSERAEPISITVKWDVHRTSPNQRGHWRPRAKLTAAGREAATLAWHVAGRPVAPGPVRVTMVVRRPRVIDEDNAIGGSKCLRDALFNKAVTPSDSREFVQIGNVHFETGSRWKNCEEVQFVIEDLRPEREAIAERQTAAKARAQSFAAAWTWERDADPSSPRLYNGVADYDGQRYSAILVEDADGRWIALGRFTGGVLNCGLAQAKRAVIKATWARLPAELREVGR